MVSVQQKCLLPRGTPLSPSSAAGNHPWQRQAKAWRVQLNNLDWNCPRDQEIACLLACACARVHAYCNVSPSPDRRNASIQLHYSQAFCLHTLSWAGSGDSGEVWCCRKEHSQTRGAGSGRHQAKEKTNTRERGVMSSSLACLLLQLRKEECANCSFRAETMPAQFFLLFSFLFSILLPQFPDSPRQILITSSALIFPVFRKSVANALRVICFIKAQDIYWFLGQVKKWKENERSSELIAHGRIHQLP